MTVDRALLEEIVEGFYFASDSYPPVDCILAEAEEFFANWVKEHYPEVYENAGDLGPYFMDEEDIEGACEFFKIIPNEYVRASIEDMRSTLREYWGLDEGRELDTSDDEHKAALETLASIEKMLATLPGA